MLTACENSQQVATRPASVSTPTMEAEIQPAALAGNYCFYADVNKDITEVNLNITGNQVTGTMNWIPLEKDSAVGRLLGNVNAAGELDLVYYYMIEGNAQTETKVMKIENKQLMIKHGELLDPKNVGDLVYKDATTATYNQTLLKVDCKK